MLLESDRIDLLLGNQQQHLMPPLVQGLGNRESREEVPPGAAAGNDKLFRDRHDAVIRYAAPDARPRQPGVGQPRGSGRRFDEC